jgi:hypothetical protein
MMCGDEPEDDGVIAGPEPDAAAIEAHLRKIETAEFDSDAEALEYLQGLIAEKALRELPQLRTDLRKLQELNAELLAALKLAQGWLYESEGDGGLYDRDTLEAMAVVRAAIAKAEGGP